MSSFSSRELTSRLDRRNTPVRRLRFFVILGILLLLFASYLVWSVSSIRVKQGKYIIENGYTVSVLNEKLGFDIAPWRYRLWLRYFGPKNISIQAGMYSAPAEVSLIDFITKTLSKPVYTDQTITILPGWSSYDIDSYLAAKGIGRVGDFLDTIRLNFPKYQADFSFLSGLSNLEGFLYPDTYRIRQDATADDAIRTMLKEFDKKMGESYRSMKPKQAYEVLILASIVEREERNTKNQPIVAGILSKRVKEGIAMGADATVCYGYAKTQKQCTPSFIGSIIRDKHPYNTRNMQGYTPTPIANVPLSAWNAAKNPESSPYYYYLHGADGQIHYGRTNDEHIANKKYLN